MTIEKLYLCEKPLQGKDVAAFLGMGPGSNRKGYCQAGDTVVTWAIGHLFRLSPPEHYEPRLADKWSFDCLPILPEKFDYTLSPKTKGQFNVIKGLLSKAKAVYIATDPDPEGECIARNVLMFAKYKGPVFRVLYGSTDQATLEKAFANPIPATETEWMARTAAARGIADWLVGMNLTIAMTLLTQKIEGREGRRAKAFKVGRVKTPTCGLVSLREKAIKNFIPRTYYSVVATVWDKDKNSFNLNLELSDNFLEDGKLFNKSYAEKAVAYLLAQKIGIVNAVKCSDKSKSPPLPYDLTRLQSAADKYGLSPSEVLDIAQSLYSSPLSCTSYPRTDTQYLSEGLADAIDKTVSNLMKISLFSDYVGHLDLDKRSKAWNSSKVEVHHGIIPTSTDLNFERLTDKQKAIYVLISKRYLAQFLPDYQYSTTTVYVDAGNLKLVAEGITPKELGWKRFEISNSENEKEPDVITFPDLKKGDKLYLAEVKIVEKKTRAPARYSQATLANAMSSIASGIDNPEDKKLLNESDGIGTVATRPTIIGDIISCSLVEEKKNQLYSGRLFEKYFSLIPEQLKNPATTAMWERGFKAIKEGTITQDEFIDFQKRFIRMAVEKLRTEFDRIK